MQIPINPVSRGLQRKPLFFHWVVSVALILLSNSLISDVVTASTTESRYAQDGQESILPATSSLTNNLAAYWTLNEVSGTRFDSVGGSPLTPRNNPTSGSGKIGNAAYFNGGGQGLCTASNPALEMGDVDYTLTAWVYLNGPVWNGYMLIAKDELAPARDYVLEYQNLGNPVNQYAMVVLNSASNGPEPWTYGAVTAPAPGFQQWTFLAARHHAVTNQVSLKINGAAPIYGTVPITPGISSAAFCLGLRNAFDLVALNGRMDEVGVWKRALTDEELDLVYNNGQGLTYPFTISPLNGSTKTVSPTTSRPGTPVTYTIALVNSNPLTPTYALLTDTLPGSLNYIPDSLMATTGTAVYGGGAITWSGTVTASSPVTVTYSAIINANIPRGTTITNTVQINSEDILVTRAAAVHVPFEKAYLPLLYKPIPGILGKVTQNGSPAPNIFLELRFFNGTSWSTWVTTNTGSDGSFALVNAPTLLPGQRLYVLYRNTSQIPGRLWLWATRELTAYTAGTTTNIGNFDIADIALVAPPDFSDISLPYLFRWAVRGATVSDSYALELYDIAGGSAYAATAPLGYVNSVVVTGLPAGFNTGTPYGWDVLAFSPDGGVGVAYETRVVLFSNSGLASLQAAEVQWIRVEQLRERPPR